MGVPALMMGARAYRAGQLEHRIDAPGSEEFDGIADQMNGMAASLVVAPERFRSPPGGRAGRPCRSRVR